MNFDELRQQYDIVPVVRELAADTLTPLAAFAALAPEDDEAFLFESVERGENLGRYSFVGFDPRRNLRFDRSARDPVFRLNDGSNSPRAASPPWPRPRSACATAPCRGSTPALR